MAASFFSSSLNGEEKNQDNRFVLVTGLQFLYMYYRGVVIQSNTSYTVRLGELATQRGLQDCNYAQGRR